MEKLDAYKIDLKAISTDAVKRDMVADDDFFAAVQGDEIQHGNVTLSMKVRQMSGAYKVQLQFDGQVQVQCDRCLCPMQQPVEGEAEFTVKLGETYEDDGEIIVVPEEDGVLDISWQVYEQIALQIPLSHVHADGECDETMQDVLAQHETLEMSDDEQREEASPDSSRETDPRWDALKKLISTNN